MARRLVLLVAAPLLALGMTGCGATLSRDEVATQAEEALEEEVGVRPNVSCPEDHAEEVGAETRCTLTAGDDPAEYGLTITVTAVDEDGAEVDVQVDEEPVGGGQ